MNNGLDITEGQFMAMKTKEQNLMLFRNIVFIRTQFKEYKVTKKIQYCWLGALTILNAAFLGIRGWII